MELQEANARAIDQLIYLCGKFDCEAEAKEIIENRQECETDDDVIRSLIDVLHWRHT